MVDINLPAIKKEEADAVGAVQVWLKERGIRAQRQTDACQTRYLVIDRRDEERAEAVRDEIENRREGSMFREYHETGAHYDEEGNLRRRPLKVYPDVLESVHHEPKPAPNPDDTHRQRHREIKDRTRPAWAKLRAVLKRHGMRWGYNDCFATHRRIKCTEDTAAFVADNLSALAIEEIHGVDIVVGRVRGTKKKSHHISPSRCLRIYPKAD